MSQNFTGLQLLLNVHVDEYMAFVLNAGMRILVHNQFDQIFPDCMGYNIAPGYQTNLIIKLVNSDLFEKQFTVFFSADQF